VEGHGGVDWSSTFWVAVFVDMLGAALVMALIADASLQKIWRRKRAEGKKKYV